MTIKKMRTIEREVLKTVGSDLIQKAGFLSPDFAFDRGYAFKSTATNQNVEIQEDHRHGMA